MAVHSGKDDFNWWMPSLGWNILYTYVWIIFFWGGQGAIRI